MEALKRWFIVNPGGATSQKKAFFIVTAVKTSNPTYFVQIDTCFYEPEGR
jgi:hypothetical protein